VPAAPRGVLDPGNTPVAVKQVMGEVMTALEGAWAGSALAAGCSSKANPRLT
jgi:hypothetical protein